MRFAVLGRTAMLFDAIEACVAAGHECASIETRPAAPEYGRDEHDFARLAERLAVPFGEPVAADVAISMNWPALLGAEVRGRFAHGIVNAHPGDLPRFRGNACPNWAILAGEEQVVLTLHVMDDGLDSGPVLLKRPIALDASTYVADVYAALATLVPDSFVTVLDGLADGSLTPQPQRGPGLRCHPRRPEDGLLDFTRPAAELARLVRASAEPFAGAFTTLDGERVTVWRARAEALDEPALGVPGQVLAGDPVAVLCGDGAGLMLERVEPAGVVRSGRQRLGT